MRRQSLNSKPATSVPTTADMRRVWRGDRCLKDSSASLYLQWVKRFRAYCAQRELDERSQLTLDGTRRFIAWHRIRASLYYAGWKDRKAAAAIKPIYTACSAKAAEAELDAFERSAWGQKFPTVAAAWRRAWDRVIPLFAFPPAVRKVIYTNCAHAGKPSGASPVGPDLRGLQRWVPRICLKLRTNSRSLPAVRSVVIRRDGQQADVFTFAVRDRAPGLRDANAVKRINSRGRSDARDLFPVQAFVTVDLLP